MIRRGAAAAGGGSNGTTPPVGLSPGGPGHIAQRMYIRRAPATGVRAQPGGILCGMYGRGSGMAAAAVCMALTAGNIPGRTAGRMVRAGVGTPGRRTRPGRNRDAIDAIGRGRTRDAIFDMPGRAFAMPGSAAAMAGRKPTGLPSPS